MRELEPNENSGDRKGSYYYFAISTIEFTKNTTGIQKENLKFLKMFDSSHGNCLRSQKCALSYPKKMIIGESESNGNHGEQKIFYYFGTLLWNLEKMQCGNKRTEIFIILFLIIVLGTASGVCVLGRLSCVDGTINFVASDRFGVGFCVCGPQEKVICDLRFDFLGLCLAY